MRKIEKIFRRLNIFLYLGIIAIILAWIIIGINWILNPWFDFFRDAYSDFGVAGACCPWLYNYGLIVTGIMLILYSLGLLPITKNNFEAIGTGYIIIAGIFLALIGVFPGGTYPHVCVASWFFIQMDLAFIVMGVGITLDQSKLGLAILTLSVLEIPLAILIQFLFGWPSAAAIETYGIVFIDLFIILTTKYFMNCLFGSC